MIAYLEQHSEKKAGSAGDWLIGSAKASEGVRSSSRRPRRSKRRAPKRNKLGVSLTGTAKRSVRLP